MRLLLAVLVLCVSVAWAWDPESLACAQRPDTVACRCLAESNRERCACEDPIAFVDSLFEVPAVGREFDRPSFMRTVNEMCNIRVMRAGPSASHPTTPLKYTVTDVMQVLQAKRACAVKYSKLCVQRNDIVEVDLRKLMTFVCSPSPHVRASNRNDLITELQRMTGFTIDKDYINTSFDDFCD